jgi:hypothetical protein
MVSPVLVYNDSEISIPKSNFAPISFLLSVIRQGGTSPFIKKQFSPVSRSGCFRRSIQVMPLYEGLICNLRGKAHYLTIQPGKCGVAEVTEERLFHFQYLQHKF